jgi:hypothetical protein
MDMDSYEAECSQCHATIDLRKEHITLACTLEQVEGDEIIITEGRQLAQFCSDKCCDEALGGLPFYWTM